MHGWFKPAQDEDGVAVENEKFTYAELRHRLLSQRNSWLSGTMVLVSRNQFR